MDTASTRPDLETFYKNGRAVQVKIHRRYVGGFLAKTPTRGTVGSACYDLYAAEKALIRPGEVAKIDTGLNVAIPVGWMMCIHPRSGKFMRGVDTAGVVDSDYRGPLYIMMHNSGNAITWVEIGERLAQCTVIPVPEIDWCDVSDLDDLGHTDRGEGGFGSTGE